MMLKVTRAIWVVLTVAVLLVTLYGFDGKPNSDIGIFLAWSMLGLAFPSSLLVALVLSGLSIASENFFSVIPTSYPMLSLTWACFFAAGYWQWFVFVPWLWRKWKTRRPARPS